MHISGCAKKQKRKAVLLEQILRRQEEYRQSLGPRSSVALADVPAVAPKIRKVKAKLVIAPTAPDAAPIEVLPAPIEVLPELPPLIEGPTDEELKALEMTDSGVYPLDEGVDTLKVFDLVSIFEKYVPKTKGAKMSFKTMGLPVPLELHERMHKFLETNKDKPGAPQSLRDVGLMCLSLAMDSIEAPHGDDESIL
jgi:hypothetical protein